MGPITVLYGESSWLRIVPGTMTSGSATEIASLGTKEDFLHAIKASPTHVGSAAAAVTKEAWLTTEIANGNKLSVPDNSANYNVMTGIAISTDSSSTASTGKIDCSVVVTPSQRLKYIDWYEDGTPVIGIREIGKNSTTGVTAGYEYIFGAITDLKDNPQKGPSTMDFAITGKVVGAGGSFTIKEPVPATPDVVYTHFNTAATGSGNTITPHNDGGARTITAIDATDWTRMLTGKIVTKNV